MARPGMDPNKIWFTSDLHFGHANILKYCPDRAWPDVEKMNRGIIDNWNSVVQPTDTVYVVGDFAMKMNREFRETILDRLAGSVCLVKGNHDHHKQVNSMPFQWVRDMYTVRVEDPDNEMVQSGNIQRIELCHFAMRVWDRSHHGAWHLYGHSHGTLPDDPDSLSCDVGIDNAANILKESPGYAWPDTIQRPLSYWEIKRFMQAKPTWPISGRADHHNEETLV